MGESNAGIIILSVLLLLLLGLSGFLYWQNHNMKDDAQLFQEAYTKASKQLADFNKVIISEDGDISYPQSKRLYVYGFGTYAYELEDVESVIGTPRALGGQSEFSLCYTLEQDGSALMIQLKNAYSEEFYNHCEGNYEFPVLVDEEEFSVFELYVIPGSETI